MLNEKEEIIIKELNVVFEKLGWKLLPENDHYLYNYSWDKIIIFNSLFIDRNYIPYEKHLNKFTIKQLDNYVVEFIKNICLKYELKRIIFNSRNEKSNSIKIIG